MVVSEPCRVRVTTYTQSTLAEDDDVHVERFEIRLTVRILVERSETDEIVVPEELDLLSSLLE